MVAKWVKPLTIQPTKDTTWCSCLLGLNGQQLGHSLVSCPLSTKMDNSTLAVLWIPPFSSHTLWISSSKLISRVTTSKFTYDVQHGTFCEDTSKSRLIGKETHGEWQKYSEVERRHREDKGMGRKGQERRQTTQGSNSGPLFTTEIHSDKTVMKHNLTQPTFPSCPHYFLSTLL